MPDPRPMGGGGGGGVAPQLWTLCVTGHAWRYWEFFLIIMCVIGKDAHI